MVEVAIGISLDEAHRMKPSQVPWARSTWPLVDLRMTRDDCLSWMAMRGYPTPPRSACVFCPYHSDAEWLRLKLEEPIEFAKAVTFDENMRRVARKATGTARYPGDVFLHGSMVPLKKVVFRERDPKADQFGNECEGICGV